MPPKAYEDGEEDEEVVRRLLQENVRWGEKLEAGSEPEPEPEPQHAAAAPPRAANAHADVHFVGKRAGQADVRPALYKWDDELEEPANEQTDAVGGSSRRRRAGTWRRPGCSWRLVPTWPTRTD